MKDLWSVVEERFDPATSQAYEGLFTTSSGYLHLRGSLEEHLFDAPQNLEYTRRPANVTAEAFLQSKSKWGAYVPGIRGMHPLLNRGLVNLPFFLELAPYVLDEKLDVEASHIEGYQRALYLRTGQLRRSLRWHTRQGAIIQVAFERFVSAVHQKVCLQRMELVSDREVAVTVRAGIDADVRTSGYDMFTNTGLEHTGTDGLRCHVTTNTGNQVSIASALILPQASWTYKLSGRHAWLEAEIPLAAGESLTVEKRSAVTSSFDQVFEDPAQTLDSIRDCSYGHLYAEHSAAWEQRWEKSDVIIEGDDASQLALRVSIYHLLRAHPDDPRLAIDPKGYAGEAYRGCYFWDTEIYLLPFFLYTDPPRARSLLEYRIHSLPGARANARHSGYAGARYAWEADVDGIETCPNWQYRDHEVHVTADIVYAMAHYARATRDEDFLAKAGEVIVETARYWLDRVDWRKGEAYPSLLGVMGPDEYTPISSNNSYTNRIAAFALSLAARLGPGVGASVEECRQFEQTAAGLPILRSPDGQLVLQCEEFDRLAEPAFERFWKDRSRPFATQIAQEWLYRSKCLKQADVLMLMMLFASEFSQEEVERAWDYYLPYTTHDSSLSAGIHAIMASRLGKTGDAWEFWRRSSLNDLDVQHGGSAEGVHIAGAGVNWQMAVFGFAGLATAMNSDILSLEPRLPENWARLAFPLVWKGSPVYVDIGLGQVEVANRSSQPVEVSIHQRRHRIGAGEILVVTPGG
ncbi:MAG: glycosyl hydrolase family 65 protein [Omnitrophica WOR_2 bacterium]